MNQLTMKRINFLNNSLNNLYKIALGHFDTLISSILLLKQELFEYRKQQCNKQRYFKSYTAMLFHLVFMRNIKEVDKIHIHE